MIIRPEERARVENFLAEAVRVGLDFKDQPAARPARLSPDAEQAILSPLPSEGASPEDVLSEFREKLLPYCVNVAAPGYMAYPMVGNSVAGTAAEFLDALLLQNLINAELSPSATLAEIAVIQWFREVLGMPACYAPRSVADIGGAIVAGGTASNMIALMLARERMFPGATEDGQWDPAACGVIVPAGVWNHTIAGGKKWLGCGSQLIEVSTDNSFRMDLVDLKRKLSLNRGRVMAVIGYAGNSKTMTIDRLADIAELTREFDQRIWLHADACFGFSLAFSEQLRHRLAGIELFDSATADPHKVLNVPYPLSVFLAREPAMLTALMGEGARALSEHELSLGLITPFFGSRPWMGLKAWFAMKNYGARGLGELIEERCSKAAQFAEAIKTDEELLLLTEIDINAVLFFYSGGLNTLDLRVLNAVSVKIHEELLAEGLYEFHLTRLRDPGILIAGEILRPLRYMSGNPQVTDAHLARVITRVKQVGRRVLAEELCA